MNSPNNTGPWWNRNRSPRTMYLRLRSLRRSKLAPKKKISNNQVSEASVIRVLQNLNNDDNRYTYTAYGVLANGTLGQIQPTFSE